VVVDVVIVSMLVVVGSSNTAAFVASGVVGTGSEGIEFVGLAEDVEFVVAVGLGFVG